jgi:hypothetical protein
MNTTFHLTPKSNINQPTRSKWCTACQMGEHCGSCICCEGRVLLPNVARLTREALDALCVDGYDWLSPQAVPGFAGPVNLAEVCGGSGLTRQPATFAPAPAAVKNTPWKGPDVAKMESAFDVAFCQAVQ